MTSGRRTGCDRGPHDGPASAGGSVTPSAYRCDVAELEIRFTEAEVPQILWVLTEAADHVVELSALSSLAMIEETLRMVRARFDQRGPG